MTTTLRINDDLYRKAKVAAAGEGITLTKFIEEGLELRIASPPSKTPPKTITLRTFGSGKPLDMSPEDIKQLLADLDAEQDAKILSGDY